MKDKRIIEEMAKLYGFDHLRGDGMGFYEGETHHIPQFLADHNAVQRVIDSFDYDTLVKYWKVIMPMCGIGFVQMIQASPRQKCEAILKAKGLWK